MANAVAFLPRAIYRRAAYDTPPSCKIFWHHSKTKCNTTTVTYRLSSVFQQFSRQTQSISQRTTVFVNTTVVTPAQEMHTQCQIVTCIDIYDVEANITCPQRRFPMPTPDICDITPSHRACLARLQRSHREIRNPHHRKSTVAIRHCMSIVN